MYAAAINASSNVYYAKITHHLSFLQATVWATDFPRRELTFEMIGEYF